MKIKVRRYPAPRPRILPWLPSGRQVLTTVSLFAATAYAIAVPVYGHSRLSEEAQTRMTAAESVYNGDYATAQGQARETLYELSTAIDAAAELLDSEPEVGEDETSLDALSRTIDGATASLHELERRIDVFADEAAAAVSAAGVQANRIMPDLERLEAELNTLNGLSDSPHRTAAVEDAEAAIDDLVEASAAVDEAVEAETERLEREQQQQQQQQPPAQQQNQGQPQPQQQPPASNQNQQQQQQQQNQSPDLRSYAEGLVRQSGYSFGGWNLSGSATLGYAYSGSLSACTITLNPLLLDRDQGTIQRLVLHEVAHCALFTHSFECRQLQTRVGVEPSADYYTTVKHGYAWYGQLPSAADQQQLRSTCGF